MKTSERTLYLSAGLMVLLLSGCMVGPKYKTPPAPAAPKFKELPAEAYKEGNGWKVAEPNDALIRGKWWEIYGDPELNALEEQVGISNQNVLAAEARYRQAQDTIRAARSGLFPTVGSSPAVTNSQSSGTLYTGNQLTSLVQRRTVFNLPLSFSYEADVWGRIRRTITQNVANAQASAADLENAKLSYQAAVAGNYFALRGLDTAEELYQRTVKLYEEYLQLTRDRQEAGIASESDVAQAETQLLSTRAQLVDIGVARAQYEHAIAVLVGKAPAEIALRKLGLPAKLPDVPVEVPSKLLERRPDIALAERQMAAANESIGIAKAAFYPSLGLSANGGFQTAHFTDWFTWPSKFWSIGPSAAQTLFDAGRRRAVVAQSEHVFDETVANYRQTVLTGFQQVEDNLAALRILSEEAGIQQQAVEAALRALDVVTAQYKAGTTDFLQVIISQSAAFSAQQGAVSISTRRMAASVSLVQALGGGWDVSQLPSSASLRK